MTEPVPQHFSYGRSALLVQIPALIATTLIAFIFQRREFTELAMTLLGLSMGTFFAIGIWSWVLIVRAVRRRESLLKWVLAAMSQLCLSGVAGFYVWHYVLTTFERGFLSGSLHVLAVGVPVVLLGGLAVLLAEFLFSARPWLRRCMAILALIIGVAPAGFFAWFLLLHIHIAQLYAKTNPYDELFKIVPAWVHGAVLDVFGAISTKSAANASIISLLYGYHSDAKLLSFLPDENGHVAAGEQSHFAAVRLLDQNPNAFSPHFRDLLNPKTPRYEAYNAFIRDGLMYGAAEKLEDAEIREFLKREPLFNSPNRIGMSVFRGISKRPFLPLQSEIEAYLRRHAATNNSLVLAGYVMESVEAKKSKLEREALREMWLRMLHDSDADVRHLVASRISFCGDWELVRELSDELLKTKDLPLRRKFLKSGSIYRDDATVEMLAKQFVVLLAETENDDAYCRYAAALGLHSLLDIQTFEKPSYTLSDDVYDAKSETDEVREYVRKVRMFAQDIFNKLKE